MGVIHEHWTAVNQKDELVMTPRGSTWCAGGRHERAVKGLDHVVVMVDGIDAAEAAYRKLGFQVQPRGFHKKLGTANHLMIFDTDYFEILGIVEDTEFNAERREWLKGGGGLANVALATDGADVAYEAFRAAGLNPDAPLFFDRAVEVAGKIELAKFRTVRIPKDNMPVVGFFVCEHQDAGIRLRPEWAAHPNGARGILGVTVIAEQPAKWTPELEKYFGPAPSSARARGWWSTRHPADPLHDAQGLCRPLSGHNAGPPGRSSGAAHDPRREPGRLRGPAEDEWRQVHEARFGPAGHPPSEAAHLTLEFSEL